MKGIILLANHFEDTEALVTIDLLRRAGITVDMVSIEKSVDLVTQYNLKIKAEFTVDQLSYIQIIHDYQFSFQLCHLILFHIMLKISH